MPTECSATLFEFAPVASRHVVASFDGGAITTDAGALLLGETDRAIRLSERFAACFTDARAPELIEHSPNLRSLSFAYSVTAALAATNSVPSTSIRCRTTASLRASATFALRMPARLATRIAQLFNDEPLTGLVRMTLAAS